MKRTLAGIATAILLSLSIAACATTTPGADKYPVTNSSGGSAPKNTFTTAQNSAIQSAVVNDPLDESAAAFWGQR